MSSAITFKIPKKCWHLKAPQARESPSLTSSSFVPSSLSPLSISACFSEEPPQLVLLEGPRRSEEGLSRYSECSQSEAPRRSEEGLSRYSECSQRESCTVVRAVTEGANGTYLVKDDQGEAEFKIFKPAEEEGYEEVRGERLSLRRGIEYGEASLKEVAAYILDHGHFAKVPRTELGFVNLSKGKDSFGSLQDYQAHVDSCENIGSSRFCVSDVHRIGLLDCRLLNTDRHLGNILVTDDNQLVPIDHGYVLPSCLQLEDINFEWLYWPQVKLPFSAECVAYVEALNPLKDRRRLQKLGIREECILGYILATFFLKLCVRQGLTLFQIASQIQRSDEATPSPFERIVDLAIQPLSRDSVEEEQPRAFYATLSARVASAYELIEGTGKQGTSETQEGKSMEHHR